MLRRLKTLLFNQKYVGVDNAGNAYFIKIEKNLNGDLIEKRFVKYAGDYDPSKLPAEWASWLSKLRVDPPIASDNVRTGQPSDIGLSQRSYISSEKAEKAGSVTRRQGNSPTIRLKSGGPL